MSEIQSGAWVAVASLAGNATNRSMSLVKQTADNFAAEVVNARGSYAGLDARLNSEMATVSMIASVRGADGNVNAASIVNAVNAQTGASSVDINADHINIDGVITAINNNLTTTISGNKIRTGSIQSNNYLENTRGSKLDLSNGVFDSKNFKIDESGNASISGAINAASGTIGSGINKWNIGTTYNIYAEYRISEEDDMGDRTVGAWIPISETEQPDFLSSAYSLTTEIRFSNQIDSVYTTLNRFQVSSDPIPLESFIIRYAVTQTSSAPSTLSRFEYTSLNNITEGSGYLWAYVQIRYTDPTEGSLVRYLTTNGHTNTLTPIGLGSLVNCRRNSAIFTAGSTLDSSGNGVYIGTDGIAINNTFRINQSGGGFIAGWNITGDEICAGRTGMVASNDTSGDYGDIGIDGDPSVVRFYAGDSIAHDAPYRVLEDGSLYASNANLSGYISAGARVNGGTSTTLNNLGICLLSGSYGWRIFVDPNNDYHLMAKPIKFDTDWHEYDDANAVADLTSSTDFSEWQTGVHASPPGAIGGFVNMTK